MFGNLDMLSALLSYKASKYVAVIAVILACASPTRSEVIGELDVDWFGNDIIVESVQDPAVTGITCHIAYFERGVIDRLQKGNWFEDPSNSAIDCQRTGDISVIDPSALEKTEEIFNSRKSLIWKKLVVKRIYDRANDSIVYVAHSREVQQGSAKMSISTVPFQNPTLEE